jgi:hypothetical protein
MKERVMLREFLGLAALLMFYSSASAEAPASYRLLKIENQFVKWGDALFGAGANVTVAIVLRPTYFDDARNCRSMAPVDDLLSGSGIGREAFQSALSEAMSAWEAAADVEFVMVDDPLEADILIGVDLDGRGWAHADVLKASSNSDVAPIERGLVCLGAAKLWKLGFGRDPNAQDLTYTLTHELGHALGLNHPNPSGEVMSFRYGENFSNLQLGDIAGVQALYGPPVMRDADRTSATLSSPRLGL